MRRPSNPSRRQVPTTGSRAFTNPARRFRSSSRPDRTGRTRPAGRSSSSRDLYAGPSWNFVFGQASLSERTGVYSFARYAPSFCGERAPDPKKIVLLRSCKVLAHETGHMFGMQHCIHYTCLMNGSNHIAESDSRQLRLCPVCLRKLQWSVGFDVVERYCLLRAVCKDARFDDEASWLDTQLVELGEVK